MTKLTKKSLDFLHILYIIFLLMEYFADLFCIEIEDSPTNLPADILQNNGITKLTFAFSKIIGEERKSTISEIQCILNDYLRIVLLPSQKLLKLYKNGTGIFDLIEPLYIDYVYEDEMYLHIEVIYITSPLEYAYVRKQEKLNF